MVTLPKFDSTLFLSTVQKYCVHLAHQVPPLILFLAKHPDVEKYDLSSLILINSEAAPLGSDLLKSACACLHGKTMILQGYGLTETSPVTHSIPFAYGMRKPGSVGIPVPNQLVKVVDVATEWHRSPNWTRGSDLYQGSQRDEGISEPT